MPQHLAVQESVTTYLTRHLLACSLTGAQVAAKAGFPKPNMLSMIKSGATRLPFGRIVPLADAIGADPKVLFRLCIQEYMPEIWEPMAELFWGERPEPVRLPVDDFLSLHPDKAPVLSREEVELIVALRATGATARQLRALMAAVQAFNDAS